MNSTFYFRLFVCFSLYLCLYVHWTDAYEPTTCIRCRRSQICNPPKCFCCRTEMPLKKEQEIPQMVFFTFDDAVTPQVASYYRQLFDASRRNPNGCPVKMTLFISHKNTVYSLVREFYQKGMEIASHSVTHSHPSSSTFMNEAKQQKKNLATRARIPENRIVGWRSPYLEPLGDAQPDVLNKLGYRYDATLTISKKNINDMAPVPFTLDFGWPYDCKIKPCPMKTHKGFWEVPVIAVKDYVKRYDCVYVDGCNNPPPDEERAYQFLWDNFNMYYKTNRAPFGVNMHASWFYYPERKAAMNRFIQDILKLGDVYLVSIKQVLDWLSNPVPLSQIMDYGPWQCDMKNHTRGRPASPKSAFDVRQEKIQQSLEERRRKQIVDEQLRIVKQHNQWMSQQQEQGQRRQTPTPLYSPTPTRLPSSLPNVQTVRSPNWQQTLLQTLPTPIQAPQSHNAPFVRFWWSRPMQAQQRNQNTPTVQAFTTRRVSEPLVGRSSMLNRFHKQQRQHALERERQLLREKELNKRKQEANQQLELQRQNDAKKAERLKQQESLRLKKEEAKRQEMKQRKAQELAQQQFEKQKQLEIQRQIELELQKQEALKLEMEKARKAELKRQKELEKQKQAELARRRALEKQRRKEAAMQELLRQQEAEKLRLAAIAKQIESARLQALEKQRLAEIARQEELKRQKAEKQRLAEIAKQKEIARLQGLEKQRLADIARQEELKRQEAEKQRLAEIAKQKEIARLQELENQRLAKIARQAEIQRQELERRRLAEIAEQKEIARLQELQRQRAAELARQEGVLRQQELEKQRLAEIERQNEIKRHQRLEKKKQAAKEKQEALLRQALEQQRQAHLERQRLAEQEKERELTRLKKLEKQLMEEKARLAEQKRLQTLDRMRQADIRQQQEIELQKAAELQRQRDLQDQIIAEITQKKAAERKAHFAAAKIQKNAKHKKTTLSTEGTFQSKVEQLEQILALKNSNNQDHVQVKDVQKILSTTATGQSTDGSNTQPILQEFIVPDVKIEPINTSAQKHQKIETQSHNLFSPNSKPMWQVDFKDLAIASKPFEKWIRRTTVPATTQIQTDSMPSNRPFTKQQAFNSPLSSKSVFQFFSFNDMTPMANFIPRKTRKPRVQHHPTNTLPVTEAPKTTLAPNVNPLQHTVKALMMGPKPMYHTETPSPETTPIPTATYRNRYVVNTTVSNTTCVQGENCIEPTCRCKSFTPPNSLKAKEVPQIVYITVDGNLNFHSYSKMNSIFSRKRLNPNGCPIKGTMFASDSGTSYRIVDLLKKSGMEVGLNGLSSSIYTDARKLKTDIQTQVSRMTKTTSLEPSDIKGWRSPQFTALGDEQFNILGNKSMYDSSLYLDQPGRRDSKTWPFTLDFALNEPCEFGRCPLQKHPGVWEVPVIPYKGPNNSGSCEYVDGCTVSPTSEEQTIDFLMANFNEFYKGNRAPFGIRLKQIWFHWYYRSNLQALIKFLDRILKRGDVYIVSVEKMLEWMKSPTPLKSLDTFAPWKC